MEYTLGARETRTIFLHGLEAAIETDDESLIAAEEGAINQFLAAALEHARTVAINCVNLTNVSKVVCKADSPKDTGLLASLVLSDDNGKEFGDYLISDGLNAIRVDLSGNGLVVITVFQIADKEC